MNLRASSASGARRRHPACPRTHDRGHARTHDRGHARTHEYAVQERQGRLACRGRGQLALEVGGAPAPPERTVDLAYLLLPRDGRFQALDRSALRPATPGREGLSDGLLLHPHTIVSMLINDLADIDNEVFLFLDDYHSVTDPAIRGAVSFLLRYAPSHLHLALTMRLEPAIAWRIACQEPVA